jgi:type II secretory pathway component PulF
MKLDEFAFVNQQLAGMLRSGIPLEGALRQMCQTMHRDPLRTELLALEADLRQGVPLNEALGRRKLPAFYSHMLTVGAQCNDLPGVLTLLADYYQRGHTLWTRLKGLVVYPLLVLFTSLALSTFLALLYGRLLSAEGADLLNILSASRGAAPSVWSLTAQLWLPVVVLAALLGALLLVFKVPAWRRACRWRIPAFKEAGLSQLASALALMLQNGVSLNEALALTRQLEHGTPAGAELDHWQARLAAGHKPFPELVSNRRLIPPLFTWLVAGSGEDWAGGFRQAAQIYYERTLHRVEMFLYAVLPVSVLALGLLIVTQVWPLVRVVTALFQPTVNPGMGE